MNQDLTSNEIRILSTLETQQMYGYEIIKEVKETSGYSMLLGSLYNTLKSMERKGFVKSYWSDETSSGGRRKYFKITALGTRVLNDVKSKLLTQWGYPVLNPSSS